MDQHGDFLGPIFPIHTQSNIRSAVEAFPPASKIQRWRCHATEHPHQTWDVEKQGTRYIAVPYYRAEFVTRAPKSSRQCQNYTTLKWSCTCTNFIKIYHVISRITPIHWQNSFMFSRDRKGFAMLGLCRGATYRTGATRPENLKTSIHSGKTHGDKIAKP